MGTNVIKLNLGSGYDKKEGYVNIDYRAECDPDLCIDIQQGLPYGDSTVDEVRAHDILEHIERDYTIFVIEEIYRVLKHGGRLDAFIPSTDGRGAFQDPTHRSYWNSNSWMYYMADSYRDLYGIKAKFRGTVRDIISNTRYSIIHTIVDVKALKEVE